MEENKNKKINFDKVLTIIGIVLIVILTPLLIMNVTMIIKSFVNEDEVPGIGKYVPFIVTTESMEDVILGGDIIICKKIDDMDALIADEEEGSIISFYDPAGNGISVVTHRIITKEKRDDGKWYFETKGDNNTGKDALWVCEDKVIAEYSFRIPILGHISLFMSTVPGLITCVILPLGLLIGYDVIRRRIYDKANQQDTEALLAELEALKAAKLDQEKASKENSEEVSE